MKCALASISSASIRVDAALARYLVDGDIPPRGAVGVVHHARFSLLRPATRPASRRSG
jgi:hypothetical protein